MPRPGPRPYEFVRRAWHSERHQPIRGFLIQEIFRVVNEIHSTATKRNKEWQEKLPFVVLRAEEIMYSKANSEAEYKDLTTLVDRTNDAINTIIRRDESTETGELLPPCIEAALILGCMPRTPPRSQRNNNPRCYLNTGIQEPGNVGNFTQGNHLIHSQSMAPYSPFMKQVIGATQNLVVQNTNGCADKLPFASQKVSPSSPASSSVYPLYYGTCFKFEETPHGFGTCFKCKETPHGFEKFANPTSNNMDPAAMNAFHNSSSVNPSTKIAQRYIRHTSDNPHDIGCDLSLRLGPFSALSPSFEHNQQEPVKEVDSSSQEGNKISDLAPKINKQVLCVPKANSNDPLDLLDTFSSRWSIEGDVDTNMRK